MSQIGNLVTGAGIATVLPGLTQLEAYLLIGDVDTANPLQGIQVEVDGVTTININSAASLISAFAKWQMEIAGSVVGNMLKLATGCVKKPTTIRLVNSGATTPVIYGFSDADNGAPILAATSTINPSSSQDFAKFSALFIGTPANVSSVEVIFADGRKSTMTMPEVDAYFAFKSQSEADGRLAGISVINNSDQSITAVRINTSSAAGGTAVLQAKLPDSFFKEVTGRG